MPLKNLRDLLPPRVVEQLGNNAPVVCRYSGLRSHPTGSPAPVKLASSHEPASTKPTTQSRDHVPASRIKARVWVGGGGSASDDAGPVMASVFINMPSARRKRGFSHYIYKKDGKRVPIFK
jgi:hypothetical protein